MSVRPDPKSDIVAMFRRVGCAIVDPNEDGWRVRADSTRFFVRCNDERDNAPGEPQGVELFFVCKTIAHEPDWKLTITEAQRLSGVPESRDTVTSIAEAEQRLRQLIEPLNRALTPYETDAQGLLRQLRKVRFPGP